jgi:hypothetical protein
MTGETPGRERRPADVEPATAGATLNLTQEMQAPSPSAMTDPPATTTNAPGGQAGGFGAAAALLALLVAVRLGRSR